MEMKSPTVAESDGNNTQDTTNALMEKHRAESKPCLVTEISSPPCSSGAKLISTKSLGFKFF